MTAYACVCVNPRMEFTRLEVIEILKQKQGKHSLRTFAKKIRISPAYLSDVYRGRRDPGPAILKAIEMAIVRHYVAPTYRFTGKEKHET